VSLDVWVKVAEGIVVLLSLVIGVFCIWRTGLVKSLEAEIRSLTRRVEEQERENASLQHRLEVAETKTKLYRNQVTVLLDLIREHKIVGAAKAAGVIADQLRQDEEDDRIAAGGEPAPAPAPIRRRRS
jgi:hypothetical protein